MTNEEFLQLVSRSERRTVDFKATFYDFTADSKAEKMRKRGLFVKDIISIANTPRSGHGYLLFGVKQGPRGQAELVGIESHPDDNLVQQMLDGLVEPHPSVGYGRVYHESKEFGYIEITNDRSLGPFFPTRDIEGAGLRRNTLYWRAGTQNKEAGQDVHKAIHEWFREGAPGHPISCTPQSIWPRVCDDLCLGESGYHFVLVLPPHLGEVDGRLSGIGAGDWTLVIDFDRQSDVDGVLSLVREQLGRHRSIHLITPDQEMSGNPSRACFYYFAQGLQGESESANAEGYRGWNKRYGAAMQHILRRFASLSPRPIVVIGFVQSDEQAKYLRYVFEASLSQFQDRCRLGVIGENEALLKQVESDTGASTYEISERDFAAGLSSIYASSSEFADSIITIPGKGGVPRTLTDTDCSWIGEDLEILHLEIGSRGGADTSPGYDFYRGGLPSWFDISLGVDVERDILHRLQTAVRQDLDRGQITRINLQHQPGAGGSTLARRVAWNLHREYPVALLTRCLARETVERISYLFSQSELPILVIREGNAVSDHEADELADLLSARHIPSVLLQVLRRHAVESESERRYFLRAMLTEGESERFRSKFQEASPDRSEEIQRISTGRLEERNPFLFGLTAFEAGFRGLATFIDNHLRDLSGPSLEVLKFLAIAQAYAQQTIHEQHFARILGLAEAKRIDFHNSLPAQVRGLLVKEDKSKWRLLHVLVAREVLRNILAQGLADERNWIARLADACCDFVSFCTPDVAEILDDLLGLIERVFFFRGDSRVIGSVGAGDSTFAEVIGAIPNAEGGLRVLRSIVERCPRVPHFWAHLGRYYAFKMHDHEKAIEASRKAIALKESDSALHHMLGMCYRSQAVDAIQNRCDIAEIIRFSERASGAFEIARKLAPDDDYSYISEVQLIVRVLDYVKSKGGSDLEGVIASEHVWVREGFQKAEDLLLHVRQRRVGEQPSQYEERCRADLDILYGNPQLALVRWQNLIDRKDGQGRPLVYCPPIRRQIVWAHLAGSRRRWNLMAPKVLRRAVELLAVNLTEEPSDDRNVRLWIQAARFLPQAPTLEVAIERVAYWSSNADTLDAVYYVFVLQAVRAISGSSLAVEQAERALEETRNRARFRRDRTRSFEWLGRGEGLSQLIHQDMLGEWNRETSFWNEVSNLRRVHGVISSIKSPAAGEISLETRLSAFFVPGKSFVLGRDMNVRVSMYLGFSYEGIRAWSVERI